MWFFVKFYFWLLVYFFNGEIIVIMIKYPFIALSLPGHPDGPPLAKPHPVAVAGTFQYYERDEAFFIPLHLQLEPGAQDRAGRKSKPDLVLVQ